MEIASKTNHRGSPHVQSTASVTLDEHFISLRAADRARVDAAAKLPLARIPQQHLSKKQRQQHEQLVAHGEIGNIRHHAASYKSTSKSKHSHKERADQTVFKTFRCSKFSFQNWVKHSGHLFPQGIARDKHKQASKPRRAEANPKDLSAPRCLRRAPCPTRRWWAWRCRTATWGSSLLYYRVSCYIISY